MQTKYICPSVTFKGTSLGTCEVSEQINIDRTEIQVDPCDTEVSGLPIYLDKGNVSCTVNVTTERLKDAREWLVDMQDGGVVVGDLVLAVTGKKVTAQGQADIDSTTTYTNAKLTGININAPKGQAATAQLTFTIDAGCTISHTYSMGN